MRLLHERARGDEGRRRGSRRGADSVHRRHDQAPGALRRGRVHRRHRGRYSSSVAPRESVEALLRGQRPGVMRIYEGHHAAQGETCARTARAPHHGARARGAPGAPGDRTDDRHRWTYAAEPRARNDGRSRRVARRPSTLEATMERESINPERPNTPRYITPPSTPALSSVGVLRFPYAQNELHALVKSALDEDGAFNDLTTIATVVSDRHARGRLVARQTRVLACVTLGLESFRTLSTT